MLCQGLSHLDFIFPHVNKGINTGYPDYFPDFTPLLYQSSFLQFHSSLAFCISSTTKLRGPALHLTITMKRFFIPLILSISSLVTARSVEDHYSDLSSRDTYLEPHLSSRNLHDSLASTQHQEPLQRMPSFEDWIKPVPQPERNLPSTGQGNSMILGTSGHTTTTNGGPTSRDRKPASNSRPSSKAGRYRR